eukprot:9497358-Pyramimonas_sp.AAC.1
MDRRTTLAGIRGETDVVVSFQSDMQHAVSSHWRDVFLPKDIDMHAASVCLQRFCPHLDISDVAPPSIEDFQTHLSRLPHSAPGPDGLPYKAFQRSPFSAQILNDMM